SCSAPPRRNPRSPDPRERGTPARGIRGWGTLGRGTPGRGILGRGTSGRTTPARGTPGWTTPARAVSARTTRPPPACRPPRPPASPSVADAGSPRRATGPRRPLRGSGVEDDKVVRADGHPGERPADG